MKPGTVSYEICVAWPDNPDGSDRSLYLELGTPTREAIAKLEVIVDELRASLKPEETEAGS